MDKTTTVIHRVFALLSFKHITLYILLLLCGLNANAQATYPVQVYTQLTPPYTSYLPSYYSGINQKLKVTLINTDMQQPSVSVYLRMQIKSSAFTIQTPENVYTDRIELQAGVPVQLSLDDLAVYFKSENMRISGARNEFLRTQMLPDNFYRFNFEVYEANTHRLLSNPRLGFAQAMIASGEPPILNLPFKGTAIAESNIPSIMFSWTPRHMNSVASAYGTEYEITLVEIFDKQVAPEAAFDYSRPIYTETTRATSFIHTAAQPMLIPGMRYAWRVRAVAREGVEEANVFKNNGYSPISWFDYTVDCKQVEQSAVVIEGRVATVTWTKTDAVDYDVQYRKKGSSKWYAGNITNGYCPIYNLKFGEKYEYKIGVRCTMNDAFIYTETKGFRMPDELARNANCGQMLANTNIANQIPTRELQAKLPILVGDFPVFITQVSGSGTFTGEGYVGIPYLKNAKIAVTFKDIVVNTDNRLISGFIETKYDINKNMIFDGDEFLTGGKGVGDIRTGEERAAYEVSFNIDASKPAVVKPFDDKSEDDIRAAEDYITSKGENPQYIITIIDENGDPQKIGVGEVPTTIKDGADNIYEVDKDGNIKQVSSKSDIVLDDKTKNIQDTTYVSFISFEKTDATRYALDQYKEIYSKVTEYDQEYKVGDTDAIRVSAKFMLPGTTDEIFVRVKPKKDFNSDKVSFIAENKTKYEAKYNGKDGWNLTIVAPEVNDGQLIYVVHEHDLGEGEVVHKTMAILKVVTYEPLSRSVTLVPVNGHNANLNTSQLEKEINDIYGRIGIEWTVNVLDKQFNYTPINKSTFNVTGSGLFSTKTDDMEAINKAFQDSVYYQEDGLYLFMLDYGASDKGELDGTSGDMPLNSHFGYLFSKPDTRTVAHELGHGAFNLEHPFSRPGRNSFKMGDLEYNLMDYPTSGNYDKATEFAKLQWDQTRKPGHVLGMFQKDKDGKSIAIHNYLPKEFANSDGSFTFLTPAGHYITLPKEIGNVLFHHGIISWGGNQNIVTGTLAQFTYNGVVYRYQLDKNTSTFSDYVKEDEPEYTWYKYSKYTTVKPDGYILGLPAKDGYKLYKFTSQGVQEHDGENNKIVEEKDFPLDVFNTSIILQAKKYEYNDLVKGNNQYSISDKEIEYLSKYGETSSHLVISKIAQIQSMYPQIVSRFFDKLETWKYPDKIWDRKVANSKELQTLHETNIKEYFIQMLESLKEYCSTQKAENIASLDENIQLYIEIYQKELNVSNTNNSYPSSQNVDKENLRIERENIRMTICQIIESLSLDEVAALPVSQKGRLINIFSDFTISNRFEKAIIRLTRNTQDDSIDDFLESLVRQNKWGTIDNKSDKLLLLKIIGGVDDAVFGIWGADNYKEFNKAIIKLASKSPSFKKQKEEEDLFYISHGYSDIFTRLWESYKRADDYPVGTTRMSVKLTKEAKIEVEVEKVVGRQTTMKINTSTPGGKQEYVEASKSVWENEDPINLNPFEPVIYVKDNDLGMLADWQKGDEYVFPALFLLYADDKASNQTISDVSMTAIDLASMATGYGELKAGVTGIRKFWAVADLINSGVNITANASSLDKNPNVKPFLDFYNLTTAASSVARIASGGAKSIYKKFKEANIDDVELDFAKKLTEFNDPANDFVNTLNKDELAVFREHYTELHSQAARRGDLAIIEKRSSDALRRIDQRMNLLDVDLNHTLISQLQNAGLEIQSVGGTTKLLNKNKETVAIFYENKFTPNKWKQAYIAKEEGYTPLQLDNGYELFQKGDDVAFGIGYQKGRVLSADEVNTYMQSTRKANAFGQPFRSGTNAIDMELEVGTRLYIVETVGQSNPGSFFTDKPIYTIEELRQTLAVKEGWKSGDLVIKAYDVKQPLKVRAGVIGKQKEGLSTAEDYLEYLKNNGKAPNTTILEGGGYQFETIDYLGGNWKNYLDEIKTFEQPLK